MFIPNPFPHFRQCHMGPHMGPYIGGTWVFSNTDALDEHQISLAVVVFIIKRWSRELPPVRRHGNIKIRTSHSGVSYFLQNLTFITHASIGLHCTIAEPRITLRTDSGNGLVYRLHVHCNSLQHGPVLVILIFSVLRRRRIRGIGRGVKCGHS